MNYLKTYSTRKTPQSEPIPGSAQVPNSAGGHAWALADHERFKRFLILGAEGGTYYIDERQLVRENADATMRHILHAGVEAVNEIVEVSRSGRAPKNDPAIFALAVAASVDDEATRRAALDAIPLVCRTGTHLFAFCEYVEQFRGWGRALKRGVADWYEGKTDDQLAYQLVKYRQRNGWTHRDVLRLSHPKPETPERSLLYSYATAQTDASEREHTPSSSKFPSIIFGFELARRAQTPKHAAKLVREYRLPREALKTEHLNDPEVWMAMLETGMPMTALIRNLATMTRLGVIAPFSEGLKLVTSQLADSERLRKARVHPLAVLSALKTYQRGRGGRGRHTWNPVAQVVDALDAAFYESFGNVEPSGKRTLLALDVSSSMSFCSIAGMGITPAEGAAAMALITAKTEPQWTITAFARQFTVVLMSPNQRLDDVLKTTEGMTFGETDCALPMLAALQEGWQVDTFVIYTDNETWAGRIHPAQALTLYRERMGIPAKLVVVGMVSNGFSIADPEDFGMLDVVGFDVATPGVISEFSKGL